MSHIDIRKIVGNKYDFAGREWWYNFNSELISADENSLNKFVAGYQQRFSHLSKSWNDELNTEWVCRCFYSTKMFMAASLMLGSLEHAKLTNLRVCIPYLQYYSLLYSLKALVMLLPEQEWKNGGLVIQTHVKTINVACSKIARIDKAWVLNDLNSPSVKDRILKLKAFREFISYRAPSDGGQLSDYDEDYLPICMLPVELAQMLSELLEQSLSKNLPDNYKPVLLKRNLESVYKTTIGKVIFDDDEDHYRIDYLRRKYPFPTNIMHMISEGHVEDFFGSWCSGEDNSSGFDPEQYWGVLFNLS